MIKCAHCRERHETVAEVKAHSLVFNQVKQVQPSVVAVAAHNIAQILVATEKPIIEKIEAEMHAMVQDAEAAEDAEVMAYKLHRDFGHPELAVTEPGMYRIGENVFQVVWNKPRTRLYATKLVPTYVAGKLHRLDFHYDKGAIYGIKPSDRMTLEDVAQLGKISGRCWVCRHTLKTAKSIAAGIGPVCAKNV